METKSLLKVQSIVKVNAFEKKRGTNATSVADINEMMHAERTPHDESTNITVSYSTSTLPVFLICFGLLTFYLACQ